MRRRLRPAAARQERLKVTAERSCGAGEDGCVVCSICLSAFAEAPELEKLKLPDCGHEFHCACAQWLADRQRACPLCRSPVNWHCLTKLSREGGRAAHADELGKGLLVGALLGDLPKVLALLERRADVNAGSATGATPLICASQRGHLQVVRALLDARANVHMATTDGITAVIGTRIYNIYIYIYIYM